MILFLVLAAMIAVVTVWFLARSMFVRPAVDREGYDGLVQLRDRLLSQLRELDVEEGDRNVDFGTAADERQRLEADLAQVLKRLEEYGPVVSAAAGAGEGHAQLRWMVLGALALVLPLASTVLYLGGHATVLSQLGQAHSLASGQVPPMVLEMVARLEQRLAEEPGDPEGWARLGRAYSVLGRDQEAQRAYARAYQLAPDNVDVVAGYAAYLLARDPASLSTQALALFRKLHALEPRHPGALWALGLAAYQERKFNEAVEFWEQLLQQLPPGSEVEPQVRRAIETARAESGKPQ